MIYGCMGGFAAIIENRWINACCAATTVHLRVVWNMLEQILPPFMCIRSLGTASPLSLASVTASHVRLRVYARRKHTAVIYWPFFFRAPPSQRCKYSAREADGVHNSHYPDLTS
jgi:hypothetical protein